MLMAVCRSGQTRFEPWQMLSKRDPGSGHLRLNVNVAEKVQECVSVAERFVCLALS